MPDGNGKRPLERPEDPNTLLIKEKVNILTNPNKLEYISVINPKAVKDFAKCYVLINEFNDDLEAVKPLIELVNKLQSLSISDGGQGRKDIVNSFNSTLPTSKNDDIFNMFRGSF